MALLLLDDNILYRLVKPTFAQPPWKDHRNSRVFPLSLEMGKNNRSHKRKQQKSKPAQSSAVSQPIHVKRRRFLTWGSIATLLTIGPVAYNAVANFVAPESALDIGAANPAFENQPYSLPFELTNKSLLLPIMSIRFSCNVPDISRMNGAEDYNLEFRPTQPIPMLLKGAETKTAHCENSVYFAGRIPDFKKLEFSLKVTFRPFPYMWERIITKRLMGIVDPVTHRFGRWTAS